MSFSFIHPWVLLALIIPIVVGTWEWRRHGMRVALPFDHGGQPTGERLRRWVNLAGSIPAILMGISIVLIAGPQRAFAGDLVRQSHNIHILVDISGSMQLNYGNTTRFEAAMSETGKFVNYRKGDAFAFSIFGTDVIDWLPLSKDVSGIGLASQFCSPELMPGWMEGTAIGNALRHVRTLMLPLQGDHMIILVTDGQSDDLGPQVTPRLAHELAGQNFRIFSIFIGNPATDSPADLQTLSSITNGKMFSPEDPSQLADTFKQIDAMVPTKYSRTERTNVDAFFPVLCVGLSLLAIQLLTSFGLRYTPW